MESTPTQDGGSDAGLRRVFAEHPRQWQRFTYVYPVVSRRSRGLSIGVNLNPDTACNFNCVYCCVNRPGRRPAVPQAKLDLDQLDRELRAMLELVVSRCIWRCEPFDAVRPSYRRLNDIAFSGDGEPTLLARFDEACRLVADRKAAFGLDKVKIVLITNATRLDRPNVKRGVAILDQNRGEVWAKLDAGTEGYYRRVNRTRVALGKVLGNIAECGRQRPIVIQTLVMQLAGEPMPDPEFDAYIDRLRELREAGCQIDAVQLYTVARRTAEANVEPLPDQHLDALATRVKAALPDLAVEVYYGVG